MRQDQEPPVGQALPQRLADLLGFDRGLPEHDVPGPAGGGQHAGPDPLRADAVHGQAAMAVGRRQPFRVGLGAVLGHRIGRGAQHGEQPGRRRGHDEASAPAAQPARQEFPRRPDVGHDVELPRPLPGFLRRVRAGAVGYPGVGAEDVDLAEVAAGRGDELTDARLGGDVPRHGVPADLRGHRGGRPGVQVVDDHPRAARGQPAGQGAADPRATAGDDGSRSLDDRHPRTHHQPLVRPRSPGIPRRVSRRPTGR